VAGSIDATDIEWYDTIKSNTTLDRQSISLRYYPLRAVAISSKKEEKRGIELSLERDNIRGNIGGFDMGSDFTWLLVSSVMT